MIIDNYGREERKENESAGVVDALPADHHIARELLSGSGYLWLGEHINKNEFPDFTIRQGIVVAVYPGVTAQEMEEQVTKPLEKYIFQYREVKKEKTVSYSKDGLCIIQVELNNDLTNKDEFWSKFKHGVQGFKDQLPDGVLAIQVNQHLSEL